MTTVGFIGLGRMGQNMVRRLLEQGISVVAFNRTAETTDEFVEEVNQREIQGTLTTVYSLSDLVTELSQPRIVLLMVKAGEPIDEVIRELVKSGLRADDIVVDCGNSLFEDTKRRFNELKERSIHYIDCGTSGGLEGARNGACLMLGGEQSIVESLDDVWNALGAWTYCGHSGAGHFVKMVHNGVEYSMNQAIGEGFALLEKSDYKFDLEKIAKSWSNGSVVRGWLIELLARAFAKDPRLEHYRGVVGGGQTGEWTLTAAQQLSVPQPMLTQALESRKQSQSNPTFATKVVSALRYEYGGHTE